MTKETARRMAADSLRDLGEGLDVLATVNSEPTLRALGVVSSLVAMALPGGRVHSWKSRVVTAACIALLPEVWAIGREVTLAAADIIDPA